MTPPGTLPPVRPFGFATLNGWRCHPQSGGSVNDLQKAQNACKQVGLPEEQAQEFIAIIQGQPYITGAGLQAKCIQTFGADGYSVQSLIPSPEEYKLVRQMMGLKEEEFLVVMRGEVWVKGNDRPFVDYGTASPKNLKGFVKFSEYPLEMANRRATNRAMRLATATGLCSVDEIKEPVVPQNGTAEPQQEPMMTEKQRALLASFAEENWLGLEEQQKLNDWLAEDRTMAKASQAIERYMELKKERTENHPEVV